MKGFLQKWGSMLPNHRTLPMRGDALSYLCAFAPSASVTGLPIWPCKCLFPKFLLMQNAMAYHGKLMCHMVHWLFFLWITFIFLRVSSSVLIQALFCPFWFWLKIHPDFTGFKRCFLVWALPYVEHETHISGMICLASGSSLGNCSSPTLLYGFYQCPHVCTWLPSLTTLICARMDVWPKIGQ